MGLPKSFKARRARWLRAAKAALEGRQSPAEPPSTPDLTRDPPCPAEP